MKWDFQAIADQLFRVTKDRGVVVWIVGDETVKFDETGSSFEQALYFKSVGFKLLDTMIYRKKSYPPAYPNLMRYANQFEFMFILVKGYKPKTFNQLKDKKNKSAGWTSNPKFRQKDGSLIEKEDVTIQEFGHRTNVWTYLTGLTFSAKDKIAHNQPAIFPEDLVRDHLLSWSIEGDLILDPFVGSGTTCVVSKRLNRRYIGIDINREYLLDAYLRIKNDKESRSKSLGGLLK